MVRAGCPEGFKRARADRKVLSREGLQSPIAIRPIRRERACMHACMVPKTDDLTTRLRMDLGRFDIG